MNKTYLVNGHKPISKSITPPPFLDGDIYVSLRTVPLMVAKSLASNFNKEINYLDSLAVDNDTLMFHDENHSFQEMLSFYRFGMFKEAKRAIKTIDSIISPDKNQIIVLDKEHYQILNYFLFGDNIVPQNFKPGSKNESLFLNYVSLTPLDLSGKSKIKINRYDGANIYTPSLLSAVRKSYWSNFFKKVKFNG